MENRIVSLDDLRKVPDDKLKAAYALNTCMVSVSQIIDYNDAFVLEQEYDAILNNLNLEVIPKDEALLNTLMELLNTITFFRIQDIKRVQLEKEYQQRVKNAIWSAVPTPTTFGMIPVNGVSTVLSLAAQVGTSYMNYRREKNNALSDKEKAEVELQITAIEQLNALRRELFTTAWRLADKYEYPDCLRLTEKQIKQYNEILMDHDEYRKYARLEAIQLNFYGYPPFWYYFAHTALYIATTNQDENIRKTYTENAKQHFTVYHKINTFNMFREDQLTASANLEYVDLLLLEEKPNYALIGETIDKAVAKAGSANDVLQLCAVAYLRVGKSEEAIKLLKILVNEDYNAVTNAKILSRLYVNKYLSCSEESQRNEVYADYKILEQRADPVYLFPLPASILDRGEWLDERFLKTQQNLLKKMYRNSLSAYAKKKNVEFNKIIPAPYSLGKNSNYYFSYTDKAKELRLRDAYRVFHSPISENYVRQLRDRSIAYEIVDILNDTIIGLEELSCFQELDKHDDLVLVVERKLRNSKVGLVDSQKKLDAEEFGYTDYRNLVDKYSFQFFTKDFFGKLNEIISEVIDNMTDMREIERWEYELSKFCSAHNLPYPETYIHTYKAIQVVDITPSDRFFYYDLIGDHNTASDIAYQEMAKYLRENLRKIMPENSLGVSVYLNTDDRFKKYWDNRKLKTSGEPLYVLKKQAVAIIKDRPKNEKNEKDLILCVDGVRVVAGKKIGNCYRYDNIQFNSKKNVFDFGYIDTAEYSNKNIRYDILKSIFANLSAIAQNSRNS